MRITAGRITVGSIVLVFSAAVCIAWIVLRPENAISAALAVFAAAYLLSVSAELIHFDLPNALAIPFVAAVSMIPACAVTGYAGLSGGAVPFAAAVERALVVGGGIVVLFVYWFRSRHPYVLANVRMRIELISLLLAALCWFVVAAKGSLAIYDGAVLLVVYIIYIRISVRRKVQRAPVESVAVRTIAGRSNSWRRLIAAALVALAGWTLALAIKPFAGGFMTAWGPEAASFVVILNVVVITAGSSLRLKPHIGLAVVLAASVAGMTLVLAAALCARAIGGWELSSIAIGGGGRSDLFMSAALVLGAAFAIMDLKFSWKGALALAAAFMAQSTTLVAGLAVPIIAVRCAVGSACIVVSAALMVKNRLVRNGLKHTMRAAWRVPQDPSFNHLSEH
jgi:hypothetical protein